MEHELPPNRPCPRCDAENLATADHCLECGAPLRRSPGPRDEILRIGDGKLVPSPRARSRFPWHGLFRLMAPPASAAAVAFFWPSVEDRGAAALATFLLVACVGTVAAFEAERHAARGSRPGGGWVVVDGILRAIGAVFAGLVAFSISLFALLLAVCYCNTR